MQSGQLKRREFITLFGGTAIACSMPAPLAMHAQPASRTYRIGFLGPALTSALPIGYYRSFLAELRELGFVEGTNLAVGFSGKAAVQQKSRDGRV